MSSTSKSVAAVVGGVALAGILVLAGITLFALSIAFPIALLVVDKVPVSVSPSDLALASQFASVAPLFVVASIASVIAALAVIVKLIHGVDSAPAV